MIVKGTKEEAKVLDRCLKATKEYVDGIYITITQPSKDVEKVCKKHNAHISHFEWVHDFAKARNFNFSQVPKDYKYIMWLDADDVPRGLEKLSKVLESDDDIYTMNYLYHFDEHGNPDVVHAKGRVVRNDGSVVWKGKIHEDLSPERDVKIRAVTDIEILHLSDGERVEDSKKRNLEIALKMKQETPDDPRTDWNLGNAYKALEMSEESLEAFHRFIENTESEEEKYIAYLRIAEVYFNDGDNKKALEQANYAIGIYPPYPDAYNMKGHILFAMNQFEKAAQFYKMALMMKPPKFTVNVWNPRDYDFFPLLNLAKCYIQMSMPMLALPCLEGALQCVPSRKDIAKIIKIIKKESKLQERVLKIAEQLRTVKDKAELKEKIEALKPEEQAHPAICVIRNTQLIKETSLGKDVVIYCYHTEKEWNPDLAKTEGVGGSEEAVMNLAEQWASKGLNVTVYNNSGYKPQKIGNVTYKPTWMWNYRDKQDVVILWRTPKALDFDINADKVLVDVHDVIPAAEFTEDRIKKVHKVMVKTNAHRELYRNVPDEKIEVIPNGMDFELFNQKFEKDQYLMVNTSSPDRSLGVLPKLFTEVKKQVPEARLQWAYGWDIFDIAHGGNERMMKWKHQVVKEMEEAGVENLGRVTQKRAAQMYLEANILAYPTEFFEIDCITVKKAQACGAIPVTTDFGALDESVKTGVKIHSKKTALDWVQPYQFQYGLEDEQAQKEWVDACVKILKTPIGDRTEMKAKMERYRWDTVANEWYNVMYGTT